MLESLIDALQRKFPTVGRKPIERGGYERVAMRDWRDEREGRDGWIQDLHVAPVALGVPVAQLFVRCFLTWFSWVLGGSRKRNLAEDRIAIPGHKPVQQIAEWLN